MARVPKGGEQGKPSVVQAPPIITIEVGGVVEDLNRFFELSSKEIILLRNDLGIF